MSKVMTDDELIEHISNSLEKIETMLHTLRTSEHPSDRQKSMKVAYWLNSYADYVLNERTFNAKNLPSYEYRSIINVDFGFRLGSEIGGWHYAVILDKRNNRTGDTITVVPLMSVKPHTKTNNYMIVLPEGVYAAFDRKLSNRYHACMKILEDARQEIEKIKAEPDVNMRRVLIEEIDIKKDRAVEVLNECKEISKQISSLKSGTVANVGQITTISKRRILNPKSHKDTLYNIKLSQDEMILIQDAIKRLYIKDAK